MHSKKKLGDYKTIEFIGGQITKRIEVDVEKGDVELGEVLVIPPRAISSGKIEREFLYPLKYKVEIDDKKKTQEGDVVLKLSTPYDAAYVTKEEEGLLVPSFCLILRIKDKSKLNPKFLTAFINSEVYAEQVKNMVSGAMTPMLTMGKIKEVAIQKFTIEEQDRIASYYEDICEFERLMKVKIDLQKQKTNAVLGENNGN